MNRPPITVIDGAKAAAARKMKRSMSIDELLSLPAPVWAIKGLIPSSGLLILHGEPAAGKTFLMLDMCMAIARGDKWRGLKTKQMGVLYVAGEGVAGLGTRMRAYARAHGIRPGTRFRVVPQAIDFPNSVDELFDEIEKIEKEVGWVADVIVLDTLARTAGGLDENSSQMSAYIEAADQLIKHGKLVAVLHHPGKDSARGMRGWSGLRGAVDVEIELTVSADGTRTATWKKQKDGEIPEPCGFRLRQIETGERDDDGQPITSCVVEHCDAAPAVPRGRPRGDKQMLLYGLIGEMLKASPVSGHGGAPAGRPCVEFDAVAARWRAAVEGRAREHQYLRRVLDAMVKNGLVAYAEGWVWTP